jgi:hypothetical protein
MTADLDDFQAQVLEALVNGYQAREGMKERIRALNEWEIARRSGFTDISYAGYLEHPVRNQVVMALTVLQRRGFVSVWERGVKYDSFVPTASGSGVVLGRAQMVGEEESGMLERPPEAPVTLHDVVERLDEIIRLLRSVESKLRGS